MIYKLLSILLMSAILILAPNTGQDKEYPAKATIQEWQILFANQDDVAKSTRDKVIAKFVAQLQQQINSDTIPTKPKK